MKKKGTKIIESKRGSNSPINKSIDHRAYKNYDK